MNQIALLIPAYKPSDRLISLIKELQQLDSHKIINTVLIVDDGNEESFENIFCEVSKNENVLIIKHAVNLGKGAALKTGFNYILTHFPDVSCIVTADADGQHAAEDILHVTDAARQNPGILILGARKFGKEVPWRSFLGNQITRMVTMFFAGITLSDTQTGLRAWPRSLCAEALKITINGYDFEMETLLRAKQYYGKTFKILEIPITTIYEEGNKSSHFNPVLDSMRIYFIFIRYCGASFATVIVDYMFFMLTYMQSHQLGLSMIVGRLFALFVSFLLNKSIVFNSKEKWYLPFVKFLLSVIFIGLISYGSISFLSSQFRINILISKITVEAVLFFAGFAILNLFVFKPREDVGCEQTDWNEYYNKPYKSGSYTRKITIATLRNLLLAFAPNKGKNIILAEIGGANSAFYDMLEEFKPKTYHVFDNNQTGLDKLKERIIPGSQMQLVLHDTDILGALLEPTADCVFSFGLIEHFDARGTSKAIKAHFDLLNKGGIAIISFPTPTWLYKATRFVSEFLNLWIFHDERPLKREEVLKSSNQFGALLYEKTLWKMFVTQHIMVFKKK